MYVWGLFFGEGSPRFLEFPAQSASGYVRALVPIDQGTSGVTIPLVTFPPVNE